MKKPLLILFFFLLSVAFISAQDSVSIVVQAGMQDSVLASVAVVQPSGMQQTDFQWRDYRDTRKELRDELRSTRSDMRAEVQGLRDSVRAASYAFIDSLPHEIRIGWGDQMFETLIWREKGYPTVLPPEYSAVYKENFRYLQHYFVEYLYSVNYWYSVGAMVDYSGVLWDEVTRNGQGLELSRTNKIFHNIVVMPVLRFSYYRSEYIALSSALGVGFNCNTSNELDYKGRYTAFAPAINISLFSVNVGKGCFYAMFDIGGMIAITSTNEVYMLGSRIFTASVGMRL